MYYWHTRVHFCFVSLFGCVCVCFFFFFFNFQSRTPFFVAYVFPHCVHRVKKKFNYVYFVSPKNSYKILSTFYFLVFWTLLEGPLLWKIGFLKSKHKTLGIVLFSSSMICTVSWSSWQDLLNQIRSLQTSINWKSTSNWNGAMFSKISSEIRR